MGIYNFLCVMVCVIGASLAENEDGQKSLEFLEALRLTTEIMSSDESLGLAQSHSNSFLRRTKQFGQFTTPTLTNFDFEDVQRRALPPYTTDFQDNLINGYRSLIADIQVRTQKSREDMDTLVSQIKLLMKNEADKAINYMTVYLEQISLYFQVIIHDRKPRNGTYCKESIVKLLGENLQLADENVTLCLALGYQRVQRLPEKLQVHFETLENLKKYSASKLFECQKQQQVGGNCSHESQDLERTVFLYETSPFPVVMAEIAIHGFKEVSDLSVCLKDIISRMMTHSVKVIGDFNRCIHNIEMPKLKYLLKFMKKYA